MVVIEPGFVVCCRSEDSWAGVGQQTRVHCIHSIGTKGIQLWQNSEQCELYREKCAVYSAVYSVQCIVCSVGLTVFNVQCYTLLRVSSVHGSLSTDLCQ